MKPPSHVNHAAEALATKLVRLGIKFGNWDPAYVAGTFIGVGIDLLMMVQPDRQKLRADIAQAVNDGIVDLDTGTARSAFEELRPAIEATYDLNEMRRKAASTNGDAKPTA
jgi:hypothetical protein